MATNFYFQSGNTSGTTSEQRLVEDLIIESLKIYGHDIFYLPRTSVKQDDVLGEDTLAQFTHAYPIEMYLTDAKGWTGEQELFTKFGIEVKDTATFVVSKRRWEESIAQQSPVLQLPNRPAEGDLLYFQKTDSMFEIKFVEHLDPFYQLGKFYVYNLQVELYRYSSEIVDTGIDEIDDDFAIASSDVFEFNVLSQAGDLILSQNSGSLVSAGYDTRTAAPTSNNTQFEDEALDILDFSVLNPFGEI